MIKAKTHPVTPIKIAILFELSFGLASSQAKQGDVEPSSLPMWEQSSRYFRFVQRSRRPERLWEPGDGNVRL